MIPLSEYLAFARQHARFLGFGFTLALVSSPGQTFFIGVFTPGISADFGLSHTDWGLVYMAGTLLSALVLTWSGGLLDRFPLRNYTICVLAGLVLACLIMSFTTGAWMLVLSIFLLRQFGQGLASLTAVTSIVRYMEQGRGKALAISSMGFSVGQAFLPFVAVIVIGLIGWRSTYQLVALAVLGLLPLTLWLLKGHHLRHQAYVSRMDSAEKAESADPALRPSLHRRQMVREGRFYLLLPALLAPSYVVTALFFHHLTLAEAKGWSEAWVTGTYWIFAASAVFASLASGPLIDRFTAARVVKFFLAPMILALLLLVPVQNAGWVIIYMILLGTNSGIQVTTYSAIWPELYGTRYIGGIKSLAGALSVLSSALGPVSVGLFLDNGFSIEQVCLFFALFCVLATMLLLAGLKQFR